MAEGASTTGEDELQTLLGERNTPANASVNANWTQDEDEEWTLYEDEALSCLHAAHGNSWDVIAQLISGRSELECRRRWLDVLDPSLSAGSWTNDEDAELVRSYGEYGKLWSLIAEGIPGHDEFECRNRSLQVVGEEAWTSAEDSNLRRLHGAHGPDWDKIASDVPNRTSLQCRHRVLLLLGFPADKRAHPENIAHPDSRASKRARAGGHANSSAKASVAGTSAFPAAKRNNGPSEVEERGEEVGTSLTSAERSVGGWRGQRSLLGPPKIERPQPTRRSKRIRKK